MSWSAGDKRLLVNMPTCQQQQQQPVKMTEASLFVFPRTGLVDVTAAPSERWLSTDSFDAAAASTGFLGRSSVVITAVSIASRSCFSNSGSEFQHSVDGLTSFPLRGLVVYAAFSSSSCHAQQWWI